MPLRLDYLAEQYEVALSCAEAERDELCRERDELRLTLGGPAGTLVSMARSLEQRLAKKREHLESERAAHEATREQLRDVERKLLSALAENVRLATELDEIEAAGKAKASL